MKDQTPAAATTEEAIVKLYSDLTGASELCARGVLIHLDIMPPDTTEHRTVSPGEATLPPERRAD